MHGRITGIAVWPAAAVLQYCNIANITSRTLHIITDAWFVVLPAGCFVRAFVLCSAPALRSMATAAN
jgi:hypothetical protein